MAKGDVTFKLTDMVLNLAGDQVLVHATAAKHLEDDSAQKHSVGAFPIAKVYPLAGFGARTILQLRNDLIADLQVQHAYLAGKTIT